MNKDLLELCMEYNDVYKVIDCLVNVNGIDSERLTLFRVMKNRLSVLEKDMFNLLVEKDGD